MKFSEGRVLNPNYIISRPIKTDPLPTDDNIPIHDKEFERIRSNENANKGEIGMQDIRPVVISPYPKVDPPIQVLPVPEFHKFHPPPSVGMVELWYYQGTQLIKKTMKYSAWTIAGIRFIYSLSLIFNKGGNMPDTTPTTKENSLPATEENSLPVLRTIVKITALIGKAVGIGGFISGLIPTETAGLIFAGSSIVKDTALYIGDWLDNKKLDKSFRE